MCSFHLSENREKGLTKLELALEAMSTSTGLFVHVKCVIVNERVGHDAFVCADRKKRAKGDAKTRSCEIQW